jgi:polyphenol oxidase
MSICQDSSEFIKVNDVYRCRALESLGWVEHGFSTRSAFPAAGSVPITTLRQVHSAEVHNGNGLEDRALEGDALIANRTGIRIGVRTADCVPILIADPQTRSVAAVHAGWRGTAAGIVARAVAQMAAEFGAESKNLQVAIGPAVRSCCYEVGSDVAVQFRDLFPEWKEADRDGGRRSLNLIEANKRLLVGARVRPDHIHDMGLCTFCCAQEFYSYRREPKNPGRMLSFIGRTL